MARVIQIFCVISLALTVQGIKVTKSSGKFAAIEKITKGLDELEALSGDPAYKKSGLPERTISMDAPGVGPLVSHAYQRLGEFNYPEALKALQSLVIFFYHDLMPSGEASNKTTCKKILQEKDLDVANLRLKEDLSRVHGIMQGCEKTNLDSDETSRDSIDAATKKINEGLDELEGEIARMKSPGAAGDTKLSLMALPGQPAYQYGSNGNETCASGYTPIQTEVDCDMAGEELGLDSNGDSLQTHGERLPYCWLGSGGKANFNPKGDSGSDKQSSKSICAAVDKPTAMQHHETRQEAIDLLKNGRWGMALGMTRTLNSLYGCRY